jgi:hypothetical protein
MSPAGNHAHAMVSPAEVGSGSVVTLTQDFRPGLILFRPDGLVPAPGYQFYLPQARRLKVGTALIDLPDFLQKRCRRLKPARALVWGLPRTSVLG